MPDQISPLRAVSTQRRYQQGADQIAPLIHDGSWSTGERLPSDRELAANLKVSRPTLRKALVDQLWSGKRQPVFRAVSNRFDFPDGAGRAVDENKVVVERIEVRDADGACRTMYAHIDAVSSILLRGAATNADRPEAM